MRALLPQEQLRNPGPNWGYRFLTRAERVLPRPVFHFLLGAGVWIALAFMPGPRENSREYLEQILGRPPTRRELWRHFMTFCEGLMRKLRTAEGRPYHCVMHATASEFTSLMAAGTPALLGTFHIGDADLLGFMLGHFRRKVYMIRLRMDNSPETRRLARQFGHAIDFIWVNEKENLLFALKHAIDSGASVAMQCDRPDFSAKLEPFLFLGRRRLFPITIYHLALIFRRPVAFCLGVPQGPSDTVVYASPVFRPDDGGKEANLRRAREHFQGFLGQVEEHLRRNPYLWFNFTPLNPTAPEEAVAPAAAAPVLP